MKSRFFEIASTVAKDAVTAEKYAAHLDELFAVLVPERIGEDFCRLQKDGTAEDAVKALAAYYRGKPSVPVDSLCAKGAYSKEVADKAVRGEMREVNVDYTFEGGEIDFLFNPTEENGPLNHEWLWQFNRHGYWGAMARAYTETGDEKYARAFSRQLLKWIAQTELPENWNGPGSAWRTIECGLRLLGSWQVTFDGFRKSPEVADVTLLLMIASMHRQSVHLVAHPRTGNWLMMESNGVFTFSSLFPELSDAEENRKIAADRLLRELEVQLLPDGMQYELSPDYHSVVFHCAANFCKLSLALGREEDVPYGYRELLRRAADAVIRLSTPAHTQPRTNDTFTIPTANFFRGMETLLGDSPVYRYFATNRAEGTPPTEENASAFLPYAGFAVMRSDWGPDAAYLCFDVGPLGVAHIHQDKLNINLYKGSSELIYDDGGGQYEQSAARTYALSGYGHNTVLVDSLAQNRSEPKTVSEPIDAGWTSNERFDYAVGTYEDAFGPYKEMLASHKREVLFVKPDFFCVTDTLRSLDGRAHDFEVLFHLDTTSVRKLTGQPNAIISEFGGDDELVIVPIDKAGRTPTLSMVSGAESPTMRGWYNGRNERSLHKAITVARKASGETECRFTSLLFPVRRGGACPTVLKNEDGTVTVRFNGKVTTIDPDALTKGV